MNVHRRQSPFRGRVARIDGPAATPCARLETCVRYGVSSPVSFEPSVWTLRIALCPMAKLDSTRRRYAESIRDQLWRRHRLRLSDRLVEAFAQIPREEFLGPPPWVIRGMPASTMWQRVAVRLAGRQARDRTTRDPGQLYRDVAVA